MKTITTITDVYTYEELSESAQEKAVNSSYAINIDYDWYEYVYEDAARVGFNITAFDIGRGNMIKGTFDLSPIDIAEAIINEHGESCDTYKEAMGFRDNYDALPEEEKDDFSSDDELATTFVYNLKECYLSMLSKEYDYLTSEEAIKETIIANEYSFTEDGKLFR